MRARRGRQVGANPPPVSAPKKPVWWAAYWAALARDGNRTAAAAACGIDRTTPQKHLKAHPEEAAEFAELEKQAIDQAADNLETEAVRRARDGWLEPVYHQGRAVGAVRRYSDVLLIFLLKGARPEKYRDRVEIMRIDLDKLTDEQLAAVHARASAGEPLAQALRAVAAASDAVN